MTKPPPKSINLNVRGMKASATVAINELSDELRRQGRTIYKLGLGQSPFPVPAPVVESLRQNAHQKDYLPVRGLRSLRDAVADYHARRDNVQRTGDDVLIGPGSKELMFLLQLVFYGDLIIPSPSWVSYAPQAQIIGRQMGYCPLHGGSRPCLQVSVVRARQKPHLTYRQSRQCSDLMRARQLIGESAHRADGVSQCPPRRVSVAQGWPRPRTNRRQVEKSRFRGTGAQAE